MESVIRLAEQPNKTLLPLTDPEEIRDTTSQQIISPFRESPQVKTRKPFIEANTKAVTLDHLQNDCITPVFSKDNEVTISHSQFIETVWECTQRMFRNCIVEEPEIG